MALFVAWRIDLVEHSTVCEETMLCCVPAAWFDVFDAEAPLIGIVVVLLGRDLRTRRAIWKAVLVFLGDRGDAGAVPVLCNDLLGLFCVKKLQIGLGDRTRAL